MKESLISFDTAKAAKAKGVYKTKGFDSNINKGYMPDGRLLGIYDVMYCEVKGVLAPTQSLLQKWLRDKHNIIVQPLTDFITWEVIVKHPDLDQIVYDTVNEKWINSYEDALEKGLQEGLKLS